MILEMFQQVNCDDEADTTFPLDFFDKKHGQMVAFTFDGKRVVKNKEKDFLWVPCEMDEVTEFDVIQLLLAACDGLNEIDVTGKEVDLRKLLPSSAWYMYYKPEVCCKEFERKCVNRDWYEKIKGKTVFVNWDNQDNFIHVVKNGKHGLAILNQTKIKWFK